MTFPNQFRFGACTRLFRFYAVQGNRIECVAGTFSTDHAVIGGSREGLDVARMVLADKGDILLCFQEDDLWRLEVFKPVLN